MLIVTGPLAVPSIVISGLPPANIVAHEENNTGIEIAKIKPLKEFLITIIIRIKLIFKSPDLEIPLLAASVRGEINITIATPIWLSIS